MPSTLDPRFAVALVTVAALATAALIVMLWPVLTRYAMARPNARSSHSVPTPQGGGIAIVATIAAVMLGLAAADVPGYREPWIAEVMVAMVTLATVGALDDIRPLPVLPRLALQIGSALLLVAALPDGARALPMLPLLVERVVLVLGLVWFINLTNFMDGIDWMTVVEIGPVCAALAVIASAGLAPSLVPALPVTLALLGGVLGFAPFNAHVARLFLGDVGSLPIGALVGWLLILLAVDGDRSVAAAAVSGGASGHLIAALILPLYYLADATITLVRRALRGEQIWQAHRSHFYQIATTRGFTVPQVTARVLALNVFLAVMAQLSLIAPTTAMRLGALALAVIATGLVLVEFARGRAGRRQPRLATRPVDCPPVPQGPASAPQITEPRS